MDPKQFRELIRMTLNKLGSHFTAPAAVELLMLSAAQETYLGRYIKQLNNGPARGVFQIEPRTEQDIWNTFLAYKPELKDRVISFTSRGSYQELDLMANLPYQIIMARIFYWRFSENLPQHDDIQGLAKYYKKYFNTHLGAATVQEAIRNYNRYAL